MRVRPAALAAGLIAVFLLAGCASTATREAPASTRADGAVPVLWSSTAPSPSAAAAVCAANQLTPVLTYRTRPGSGVWRLLLTMTNTSDVPGTVSGWVTVGLTVGGRFQVPLPRYHRVPLPTPATVVQIAPGQAAYAGVKWAPCSPAAPTECSSGSAMIVAPPDCQCAGTPTQLQDFPTASIEIRRIWVGTLQPTAQRALGW
jgi:hypothetical protein